jgi:phosphate transport system substrate-binding protein
MVPNMEAFVAAASAADWTVPNFAADLVDLAGADVWPIVSPTFILLPTNPAADKVDGSRNSMRFFDWAFRNGGQSARQLEYIALPTSVHDRVRAAWAAQVKTPGGSAIWTA